MDKQLINLAIFIFLIGSLTSAIPLQHHDVTPVLHTSALSSASTDEHAVKDIVEDIVEDMVINNYDGEGLLSDKSNHKAETSGHISIPSKSAHIDKDTVDQISFTNNNKVLAKSDSARKKTSPLVEDIVIRAHEDEEIVPSAGGVPQSPVLHREVNEVFIEPLGDDKALRLVGDDLETAATLVFRPVFRYDKKSRKRLGRTSTKRRTKRPRPPRH